ncbi:DUF2752 domain-containing protein [Cellulomonas sp. PSBB021]|uniref:DUF2752 domain-containing protein n=1 Tax=Cellulomonas sp. PSBB021 TaxID=2003551 RepID=UPI000B8D3327|nr:DUF2752 domain-containing protein [Cellulomonas sp. PSBB021]ASR54467.1 hypothetical protein CBP52_04235 [Cellulomonas sp. PSBB021]
MDAPVVDPHVAATPAPARRQRAWRGPALAAGVVLVGTAAVALRDPHVSGSYGYCPLYAATGLFCPACGGLRATHDLAHGDLAAAWSMNPLWVALVPVVVALWVWWAVRVARGRAAPLLPSWSAWLFLTLLAVFGVLRNLPGLEALAP